MNEGASDKPLASNGTTTEVGRRLEDFVPPEHLPQVEMIVRQTIGEIVAHSGPLPPSNELARYKEVDPSFAERIVRMAEREQAHRHALPGAFLEKDYRLKARGQFFALGLATAILLFAAYLAFLGDTDMAGRVAIGTLIGIVGIFVGGRAFDAYGASRDQKGVPGDE